MRCRRPSATVSSASTTHLSPRCTHPLPHYYSHTTPTPPPRRCRSHPCASTCRATCRASCRATAGIYVFLPCEQQATACVAAAVTVLCLCARVRPARCSPHGQGGVVLHRPRRCAAARRVRARLCATGGRRPDTRPAASRLDRRAHLGDQGCGAGALARGAQRLPHARPGQARARKVRTSPACHLLGDGRARLRCDQVRRRHHGCTPRAQACAPPGAHACAAICASWHVSACVGVCGLRVRVRLCCTSAEYALSHGCGVCRPSTIRR
jgi:hypothetical protein